MSNDNIGEIVLLPQELALEQARNAESAADLLRLDVEAINEGEARPGAHFANAALYAWMEARRLTDKVNELSSQLENTCRYGRDCRQKAIAVGQQILGVKAHYGQGADVTELEQERGDWLRSFKDHASIADMQAQQITDLYNGDLAIAFTSTRFFLNQVAPPLEATKHFVAMSGFAGCLPDYCDVYDSAQEAAASIGLLFDLSQEEIARLASQNYIILDDAGADYASIHVCDCKTPEVHCDYQ